MRRYAVALVAVGVALAIVVGTVVRRSHQATAKEQSNLPQVEGKRIVFPADYARRIGLEAIEVGKLAVVPAHSVVGTATFDPAHVARIGARMRGLVRDVYRFEGTQVTAGDPLASIDSPELGEAQAAVAMLAAENGAAERHQRREDALSELHLTTPRDVEEARASAHRSTALLSAAKQRVSALAGRSSGTAGRNLGVHVLSAPISGTLIERHVSRGQLVEANHFAFLIANLDHLWVELSVYERILPSIKVGDVVELHAEANGSAADIIQGEVAQIGAVLNSETRGAIVRVQVDNRDRRFRPGQSVNAVIRATAAAVDDDPTVPSSAVVYVDGEPSVFIADSETSVIVTAVELGETNGQEVQVRDGVEAGQRVVIRGTNELRNELFR